MDFKDLLNQYIAALHCNAKELADASGLSTAVVSRYRSGHRTPAPDSVQLVNLSKGIAEIAAKNHLEGLDADTVLQTFSSSLKKDVNTALFARRIDLVIISLKINVSEMAKSLTYDASFISRIRSGKRIPADMKFFIRNFALYVARHYDSETDIRIIASLIGTDPESLKDPDKYQTVLDNWLLEALETESASAEESPADTPDSEQ